MSTRLRTMTMCCAMFALSAGGASAWAGEHRTCCKLEADIDELDADLYPDGEGWLLRVRYEVDVEDACAAERLTLSLQFSDHDCRIADADGRALTRTIALDRPAKCDEDEQTFEGWVEIRLAGDAIGDPEELEVHATVARTGDSRVLDDENSSVDAHLPRVVVECAPRLVEVRRFEPVVVDAVRPFRRSVVYVRPECRSAVVIVRRPYYVHVGVRW